MLQNVRKITEKVKKSRYVGKNFRIWGKIRICPEKYLYISKNYDMSGKKSPLASIFGKRNIN
jgi:hypothetical protein